MQLLQSQGVHAGLVNTMRHRVPAYRLIETPLQVYAPAPCLGQHNRQVYLELLGLAEEEYRSLEEQGALE